MAVSVMEDQIEHFFKLATLIDPETDCLRIEEAAKYGINSFAEWKKTMDSSLDWLKKNHLIVRLNLARLRKKWPSCCEVLEQILER